MENIEKLLSVQVKNYSLDNQIDLKDISNDLLDSYDSIIESKLYEGLSISKVTNIIKCNITINELVKYITSDLLNLSNGFSDDLFKIVINQIESTIGTTTVDSNNILPQIIIILNVYIQYRIYNWNLIEDVIRRDNEDTNDISEVNQIVDTLVKEKKISSYVLNQSILVYKLKEITIIIDIFKNYNSNELSKYLLSFNSTINYLVNQLIINELDKYINILVLLYYKRLDSNIDFVIALLHHPFFKQKSYCLPFHIIQNFNQSNYNKNLNVVSKNLIHKYLLLLCNCLNYYKLFNNLKNSIIVSNEIENNISKLILNIEQSNIRLVVSLLFGIFFVSYPSLYSTNLVTNLSPINRLGRELLDLSIDNNTLLILSNYFIFDVSSVDSNLYKTIILEMVNVYIYQSIAIYRTIDIENILSLLHFISSNNEDAILSLWESIDIFLLNHRNNQITVHPICLLLDKLMNDCTYNRENFLQLLDILIVDAFTARKSMEMLNTSIYLSNIYSLKQLKSDVLIKYKDSYIDINAFNKYIGNYSDNIDRLIDQEVKLKCLDLSIYHSIGLTAPNINSIGIIVTAVDKSPNQLTDKSTGKYVDLSIDKSLDKCADREVDIIIKWDDRSNWWSVVIDAITCDNRCYSDTYNDISNQSFSLISKLLSYDPTNTSSFLSTYIDEWLLYKICRDINPSIYPILSKYNESVFKLKNENVVDRLNSYILMEPKDSRKAVSQILNPKVISAVISRANSFLFNNQPIYNTIHLFLSITIHNFIEVLAINKLNDAKQISASSVITYMDTLYNMFECPEPWPQILIFLLKNESTITKIVDLLKLKSDNTVNKSIIKLLDRLLVYIPVHPITTLSNIFRKAFNQKNSESNIDFNSLSYYDLTNELENHNYRIDSQIIRIVISKISTDKDDSISLSEINKYVDKLNNKQIPLSSSEQEKNFQLLLVYLSEPLFPNDVNLNLSISNYITECLLGFIDSPVEKKLTTFACDILTRCLKAPNNYKIDLEKSIDNTIDLPLSSYVHLNLSNITTTRGNHIIRSLLDLSILLGLSNIGNDITIETDLHPVTLLPIDFIYITDDVKANTNSALHLLIQIIDLLIYSHNIEKSIRVDLSTILSTKIYSRVIRQTDSQIDCNYLTILFSYINLSGDCLDITNLSIQVLNKVNYYLYLTTSKSISIATYLSIYDISVIAQMICYHLSTSTSTSKKNDLLDLLINLALFQPLSFSLLCSLTNCLSSNPPEKISCYLSNNPKKFLPIYLHKNLSTYVQVSSLPKYISIDAIENPIINISTTPMIDLRNSILPFTILQLTSKVESLYTNHSVFLLKLYELIYALLNKSSNYLPIQNMIVYLSTTPKFWDFVGFPLMKDLPNYTKLDSLIEDDTHTNIISNCVVTIDNAVSIILLHSKVLDILSIERQGIFLSISSSIYQFVNKQVDSFMIKANESHRFNAWLKFYSSIDIDFKTNNQILLELKNHISQYFHYDIDKYIIKYFNRLYLTCDRSIYQPLSYNCLVGNQIPNQFDIEVNSSIPSNYITILSSQHLVNINKYKYLQSCFEKINTFVHLIDSQFNLFNSWKKFMLVYVIPTNLSDKQSSSNALYQSWNKTLSRSDDSIVLIRKDSLASLSSDDVSYSLSTPPDSPYVTISSHGHSPIIGSETKNSPNMNNFFVANSSFLGDKRSYEVVNEIVSQLDDYSSNNIDLVYYNYSLVDLSIYLLYIYLVKCYMLLSMLFHQIRYVDRKTSDPSYSKTIVRSTDRVRFSLNDIKHILDVIIVFYKHVDAQISGLLKKSLGSNGIQLVDKFRELSIYIKNYLLSCILLILHTLDLSIFSDEIQMQWDIRYLDIFKLVNYEVSTGNEIIRKFDCKVSRKIDNKIIGKLINKSDYLNTKNDNEFHILMAKYLSTNKQICYRIISKCLPIYQYVNNPIIYESIYPKWLNESLGFKSNYLSTFIFILKYCNQLNSNVVKWIHRYSNSKRKYLDSKIANQLISKSKARKLDSDIVNKLDKQLDKQLDKLTDTQIDKSISDNLDSKNLSNVDSRIVSVIDNKLSTKLFNDFSNPLDNESITTDSKDEIDKELNICLYLIDLLDILINCLTLSIITSNDINLPNLINLLIDLPQLKQYQSQLQKQCSELNIYLISLYMGYNSLSLDESVISNLYNKVLVFLSVYLRSSKSNLSSDNSTIAHKCLERFVYNYPFLLLLPMFSLYSLTIPMNVSNYLSYLSLHQLFLSQNTISLFVCINDYLSNDLINYLSNYISNYLPNYVQSNSKNYLPHDLPNYLHGCIVALSTILCKQTDSKLDNKLDSKIDSYIDSKIDQYIDRNNYHVIYTIKKIAKPISKNEKQSNKIDNNAYISIDQKQIDSYLPKSVTSHSEFIKVFIDELIVLSTVLSKWLVTSIHPPFYSTEAKLTSYLNDDISINIDINFPSLLTSCPVINGSSVYYTKSTSNTTSNNTRKQNSILDTSDVITSSTVTTNELVLCGTIVKIHSSNDSNNRNYDILLSDGTIDREVDHNAVKSTYLPFLQFQPTIDLSISTYPFYLSYQQFINRSSSNTITSTNIKTNLIDESQILPFARLSNNIIYNDNDAIPNISTVTIIAHKSKSLALKLSSAYLIRYLRFVISIESVNSNTSIIISQISYCILSIITQHARFIINDKIYNYTIQLLIDQLIELIDLLTNRFIKSKNPLNNDIEFNDYLIKIANRYINEMRYLYPWLDNQVDSDWKTPSRASPYQGKKFGLRSEVQWVASPREL